MIKAMILAAGRGERMRPLTDTIPKPLLQIGSYTLIERHLIALQKIGIAEVVINVHHLAEQIMSALGDGQRYGLKISYSQETELLDTGGGICHALPLLGAEPFLLVSADIFSDFSMQSLLQIAQNMQSLNNWAHLVLVDNPVFHPRGDFGLDAQGNITLQQPKLTYANYAVLHPQLFANCDKKKFPLVELLLMAIEQQKIRGEHYTGFWDNLGTLQQLENARKRF